MKLIKESPLFFILICTGVLYALLYLEQLPDLLSAKEKEAEVAIEWEEMQEAGKFAFGFHYNTNVIAEEKAVAIALEAVADGVVRIFQDTKPLEDLNQPITVNEGDTFTFIKLTMLSGRMW